MSESTIAAISTPLGEGGIGIVRLSGIDAFAVADRVFRSVSGKKIAEIKGYTALFGTVFDGNRTIDEAVALKFCAPKSYTGENVVELSVHGGRLMVRTVLRAVLAAGAVCAEPGEFSKRAFLNGKMDLTKAESVMNLISAGNDSALRMAENASLGHVADKINWLEKSLLDAAAAIAVFSDYPEEDLPELSDEVFAAKLSAALSDLDKMLNDYDTGRILREGIDTAIVGKPNVGKSTLMNLLSGADRSIVTDVAGTTRDVIEDTVVLGNLVLRLADTAGIRKTSDVVESVGVNLAKDRLKGADLVLAVYDTSVPPTEEDRTLTESLFGKTALAVLNKSDRKAYDYDSLLGDLPRVFVSAKSGNGIDELRAQVETLIGTAGFDPDSAVLLNERQRDMAKKARDAVKEALDALKSGYTVDAVGICVDDALGFLAMLTGKRVPTEVADEIFRKFCVGK